MRIVYRGLAVAALAGVISVAACGKKSSDKKTTKATTPTSAVLADEAEIAIKGKLNLTGTSTSLNLLDDASGNPTLSELSIYCVTFANPPQSGTGTVGADGTFSLSIKAAQVAVGCFILKGEEQVGTLVFKNPAKKKLDGTAKTDQRLALSGDADLGTVNLNLETGKAEVDVSQIQVKLKDTTAAQAAAFDFSGSYKISSAGITMPTGYVAACPPGTQNCKGPSEGEPIWIKRVSGKSTADNSPMFGIMIWKSEADFAACGSKLGITFADAIAHGGVDLSGSGIAEGEFTWDAAFADGWKHSGATARWMMARMEPGTVGGYEGNKQYFRRYRTQNQGVESIVDTAGYSFNVNSAETGCKLAGKPYQLNDWSGMTPVSNEEKGSGLYKHTSSMELPNGGGTVTCVNIGGQFALNGTPINGYANWNNDAAQSDFESYASAGALCSSMAETSEAHKLAKLRCYADGLRERAEGGSCVKKISTDWSADTAAEFLVKNSGPEKAMNEHIFELFEYDSSNSGSFRNEEVRTEGIQVGSNWTDCKVQEVLTMSLRKIEGSNDLQAEMISDTRNISPKPACIASAASGTGRFGASKSIFKLVKQ